MYTSFSIENFRLFDQLTVEPLARVNLIAGQNNAGKTALLEAIMALSTPDRPERVQLLAQERGLQTVDEDRVFEDLFYGFKADNKIIVSARDSANNDVRTLNIYRQQRSQYQIDIARSSNPAILPASPDVNITSPYALVFDYSDGQNRTMQHMTWLESHDTASGAMTRFVSYRYPEADPDINVRRVSPIPTHSRFNETAVAADFGKALLEGRLPVVEANVQILEPRLKGLTAVPNRSGGSSIYVNCGTTPMIPIALLGEGTKRLLAWTLKLTQASGQIMVIDEIENGIHHSALHDVWKQIAILSKAFDTQIFATTHSYECIVAANNAFTELGSDDLHLHRLYRRSPSESVKAVTYTKEALDTNVEYLWELR